MANSKISRAEDHPPLSEMLKDFVRDLDSDVGWTEHETIDRELAEDFQGFTSPSRALITSILKKYGRDHLEDSLDDHYVRKALRDTPKLVRRTLQLETMAAQEMPLTDATFFLREATRCYIYGFWAACVTLSRSALEQGVKEAIAKATGSTATEGKLSKIVETARTLELADAAVLSLAEQVTAPTISES